MPRLFALSTTSVIPSAAVVAVMVVALSGCGGSPTPASTAPPDRPTGTSSTPTVQPSTTPTTRTPTAPPSTASSTAPKKATGAKAALARPTKVLVVIEENHSYAQMRQGMPFLARVSETYGYATHWSAIAHPSEPNYLAIAGGSTFGVTDDGSPQANERRVGNADSVFDLALAVGKTAATYAQSMPENCRRSDYREGGATYAVRHNPWVYFTAGRVGCRRGDQPLPAFAHDAATNSLPNVGFLIPDLDHDAHDGTLSAADDWLRTTLSPALASTDFTSGRLVVVVTADEDDRRSGNTVLTSVLTPALSRKVATAPLTHYSLTRYLCQVLGVPPLRNAATAPDLAAAFGL